MWTELLPVLSTPARVLALMILPLLGSESCAERDAAEWAISALAVAADDAGCFAPGLKSPDAEVRRRCKRIRDAYRNVWPADEELLPTLHYVAGATPDCPVRRRMGEELVLTVQMCYQVEGGWALAGPASRRAARDYCEWLFSRGHRRRDVLRVLGDAAERRARSCSCGEDCREGLD